MVPAAVLGVPSIISVSVGLTTGESAVSITGDVTIQIATAVEGSIVMPADQTQVEIRKLALSGCSVSYDAREGPDLQAETCRWKRA